MTIIVDDAGSGDLLFGVVIGAYREETDQFTYDIIDVGFFQEAFSEKKYLIESSRIVFNLLKKLNIKPKEKIKICQGSIFDKAVSSLQEKYGKEQISKTKITGELQKLVEESYLDEIRNLGYEPLEDRESKRAKSFFHMMRWLKANPRRLKFAKTGWPRLKRYKLFKNIKKIKSSSKAVCNKCGKSCEVPFKPDKKRAVFCYGCLKKEKIRKGYRRS